jgi:sn-glycerol 3-phosphate transport system permease protein
MMQNHFENRQWKRRFLLYLPKLPGDIFKTIVLLVFAFPFYWMLITAFKTYGESIIVPPTLWPKEFTFESFKTIGQLGGGLWLYAQNSVVITGSIIILQLVVMVPAAYAFAKRRFPLMGILFGIVLIAFMIPEQITYISVFLMMSKFKLINTLWPQIIPFGANAFGIFLLRQSFKQVPDEIVECAKLDNATEIRS